MIDIEPFARLVSADHGLAVVALALPDGTAHTSVTNAGVLAHPVTGATVVGVVARGNARKLGYLRAHPRATIVLRAGWQWSAVEGPVRAGRAGRPAARRRRGPAPTAAAGRYSPPQAAVTTTSPSTTGSWPPSDGPPSC